MTEPNPKAFWKRALASIGTAERESTLNPNDSASSAYYAAFYAVSALLAVKGMIFNSHDGVDIALNRDLIKTGIFPRAIGQKYKSLRKSRNIGDYMVSSDISIEEAKEDLATAKAIIEAVYHQKPEELTRPGWMQEP